MYKALHKETGEYVAIKVIQLTEQDIVFDIQKEISMLRECNHPNVVRYIVRSITLEPSLQPKLPKSSAFLCFLHAYSSCPGTGGPVPVRLHAAD